MLKELFHLHNRKDKDTVTSCGNQSQVLVLILYLLLSVSHKITAAHWSQVFLIHSDAEDLVAKLMLPSYPLQPFLAWPTQLLAKCA